MRFWGRFAAHRDTRPLPQWHCARRPMWGLLCRPLEGSLRSERGYYAVLPPRKRRGALIERFVDWLEQERSL